MGQGRSCKHHSVKYYAQEIRSSAGQVRAIPDGLRSMRVAAINVGDGVPGALNKDGQDDLEATCHLSQARGAQPAGNVCRDIPMHVC